MKLDVNLPTIIEARDYHEFRALEESAGVIIPGLKVYEVMLDRNSGLYYGVAYVGNRKEPEVQKLIKELKRSEKEAETEAEEHR